MPCHFLLSTFFGGKGAWQAVGRWRTLVDGNDFLVSKYLQRRGRGDAQVAAYHEGSLGKG